MPFTQLRIAIATINLVGSVCSMLGAGFIATCYLFIPMRRHFRHALICNLAVADFANALNNVVSGTWILYHGEDLQPGAGCLTNGSIEQLTVQATDTSIFVIAFVTVVAITRKTYITDEVPRSTELLICGATWILPLITASTALAQHWIQPVSGNWCWITPTPVYLRYALTHAWRFAFIIAEIVMYTYLHIYIRKHFKNLSAAGGSTDNATANNHGHIELRPHTGNKVSCFVRGLKSENLESRSESASPSMRKLREESLVLPDDERPSSTPQRFEVTMTHDLRTDVQRGNARELALSQETVTTTITGADLTNEKSSEGLSNSINPFTHRRVSMTEIETSRLNHKAASRPKKIQRVLLLNAYPAAYIILWIPGIINRLYEATGRMSPALQILQASTQFVGFANAITYGWNERIGQQLMKKFRDRR